MSEVEPSPCANCGVNTTPWPPADGTWEWYMVTDYTWAEAGMPTGAREHDGQGFLCIGCLEARLGRPLVRTDFIYAPVNLPNPIDTPRLWALKPGAGLLGR